jgi:hypothetical protein
VRHNALITNPIENGCSLREINENAAVPGFKKLPARFLDCVIKDGLT